MRDQRSFNQQDSDDQRGSQRQGGRGQKQGGKKKNFFFFQNVKPKPSGEGLHKCFAMDGFVDPSIACLIKTKSSETLAVINKPRHIIYCLSYLSNLSQAQKQGEKKEKRYHMLEMKSWMPLPLLWRRENRRLADLVNLVCVGQCVCGVTSVFWHLMRDQQWEPGLCGW